MTGVGTEDETRTFFNPNRTSPLPPAVREIAEYLNNKRMLLSAAVFMLKMTPPSQGGRVARVAVRNGFIMAEIINGGGASVTFRVISFR